MEWTAWCNEGWTTTKRRCSVKFHQICCLVLIESVAPCCQLLLSHLPKTVQSLQPKNRVRATNHQLHLHRKQCTCACPDLIEVYNTHKSQTGWHSWNPKWAPKNLIRNSLRFKRVIPWGDVGIQDCWQFVGPRHSCLCHEVWVYLHWRSSTESIWKGIAPCSIFPGI